MIGKTIDGKYRIDSRIGSGGFATVYRAQDLRTKKMVAVKVLHAQLARNPAYVERFRREAQLARTLTSPYVVRVLDYGQFAGQYYLVMEYVRGRTLAQIIRQQAPLPTSQALAWARQVCEALDAARRAGIVHRDIKPQNIMLTPEGRVKVMDFGIARIPFLSSLTLTGAFLGTPQYMSPEQIRDRPVDTRSDLYSLGIVLYEMLTGRRPFDAESGWAVLHQQTDTPPIPVRARNRSVPAAVNTVVMKALAKNPRQRYQTPLHMRRALEQAGRPKPIREPRRTGGGTAWPWLVGAGGLLLIVAVIVGLGNRRKPVLVTPPPLASVTEEAALATGSQPVAVSEHAPGQTPVDSGATPLAAMKRYEHDALGLSMQYPASWVAEEETSDGMYVALFAEEEGWLWSETLPPAAFAVIGQSYGTLDFEALPVDEAMLEILLSSEVLAGEAARIVLEYGVQELQADPGETDLTVEPVHSCVVGGKEGAGVFFEVADPIAEVSVKGLVTLVLTKDTLYLVVAAANPGVWDEQWPTLEAMLESVSFVGP